MAEPDLRRTQPRPHRLLDFFLRAQDEQDNLTFRAPPHDQALVEPLIDGVETFKAMEEVIAHAQDSVHLALWLFEPDTPLLSHGTRGSGMSTWADLLRMIAARGCQVQIILADFDPILKPRLHRQSWSAYRRLLNTAARLGASNREQFQVICSRHDATFRWGGAGKILLEDHLKKIVDDLNGVVKTGTADAAHQLFENMPGLWKSIEFVEKTKKFRMSREPDFTLRPASHHQKICIVDGKIAFCGGLDVNPWRIATQKHTGTRMDVLWHDVHCRVEGGPAGDIERNFIGRWNREEPRFKEFVKSVNIIQRTFKVPTHHTSPISGTPQVVRTTPGRSFAQIHRTSSANAFLSPVPNNLRRDIAEDYEKAIRHADRYVYIENQYVRSPQLADWLIERHKNVPDLQVIIVLPVAPEEVAESGGPDRVTLHGLFLQHEVLARLQAEFGKNLGLYSMVMRALAPRKGGEHETNFLGSFQIYVHTKCLIVDDFFASIGSANTNPRSFEVDTELAIGWSEPASVIQLRKKLWNEQLGSPRNMARWVAKDYVREWDKIAKANAKAQPEKRRGFIVPHDPPKFPGVKDWLIPDAFV